MLPVPLYDTITFERSDAGLQLSCSDAALPVDDRNLVYRAAKSFFTERGIAPGVRIHLEKRIPMAAGLGGGSGNAATTLLGLNELFDHALSADAIAALAAGIGSDVPFFLQTNPALATGRGEIIKPLRPFASLNGFHLIIAHPGFGIPTPWAYQQLGRFPEALRGRPGRAERLIELLRQDITAASPEFYNSLEGPALRKYPLLALFQRFFREAGAVGTLMSGSGSSTFALAPDAASAERILAGFHDRFGNRIWTRSMPL